MDVRFVEHVGMLCLGAAVPLGFVGIVLTTKAEFLLRDATARGITVGGAALLLLVVSAAIAVTWNLE